MSRRRDLIVFGVNAVAVSTLVMPVLLLVVYPMYERIMRQPDLDVTTKVLLSIIMMVGCMIYSCAIGMIVGTVTGNFMRKRDNKKAKKK